MEKEIIMEEAAEAVQNHEEAVKRAENWEWQMEVSAGKYIWNLRSGHP